MRRLSLPSTTNKPTDINLPKSRYYDDFDEKEKLGKGAYGSVFKVQNKLDSLYYAVKKIQFRSSPTTFHDKVMREVKTLASLNHPNVVRYHSAWLEEEGSLHTLFDGKQSLSCITEEDSHATSAASFFDHADHSADADRAWDDHSQHELTWGDDLCEDERSYSDMEQFNNFDFDNEEFVNAKFFPFNNQHAYTSATITSTVTATSIDSNKALKKSLRVTPPRKISKKRSNSVGFAANMATLFIVMQLYSTTLAQFLDNRFSFEHVDPQQSRDIFRQICKGLKYIHSKGIIHRDLKPGNIFLSYRNDHTAQEAGTIGPLTPRPGELLVSLGDFGLAIQHSTPLSSPSHSPLPETSFVRSCGSTADSPLARSIEFGASLLSSSAPSSFLSYQVKASSSNSSFPLYECKKHTSAIGTLTYASPEQLSEKEYNEKTDIYSLGIIFFELYHPFTTKMERARVLGDLRNRILPPYFLHQYPAESAFILRLMSPDAAERPSIDEILRDELLDEDLVYMDKKEFLEMRQEIHQKETKIKEQEEMIRMLQEQLRLQTKTVSPSSSFNYQSSYAYF